MIKNRAFLKSVLVSRSFKKKIIIIFVCLIVAYYILFPKEYIRHYYDMCDAYPNDLSNYICRTFKSFHFKKFKIS